jgi:hypothetical protein
MELDRFIDDIHAQLDAAAQAGGDDARQLAERLAAPLDAAIRLALQDALAAAAEEITVELAPGSVQLQLRGREPIFVVSPPEPNDESDGGDEGLSAASSSSAEGDDTIARINVRMPEHLTARVDRAAEREGLSINSWLVRAAAARLERGEGQRGRAQRAPTGSQRYQGWAR